MTEKFTRGEWEIEERSASFNGLRRFGFQVISPKERKRVCYSETDDERNIPEMRANAALIAAAPEMYDVLKRLVDLTDYAELVGVIHDAKAVLNKARGEE